MIKEHKIDVQMSKFVYEKMGNSIQPKQCYDNIFKVVTEFSDKFYTNEWKVAYGYVQAVDRLFARHCFIVDNNGSVIDPTRATLSSFADDDDARYISFKILSAEDYIDLIENDDMNPTLFTTVTKEDKMAQEWGREQGFIFCG